MFGSQEIASVLVSFQMIFVALQSEIEMQFHSKSLKILEFNLIICDQNNKLSQQNKSALNAPQWRSFSLFLIYIFATGSAVRADLFYEDGLHLL